MKYKKIEVDENEVIAFMNNWSAYFNQCEKIVTSQEYIDWLYNYVSTRKYLTDEDALYSEDIDVSENGQKLSSFFDHIAECAQQQDVQVNSDVDSRFPSESVIVKIYDKYFELFTIYGQGAITGITLLEEEPSGAYVKLQEVL